MFLRILLIIQLICTQSYLFAQDTIYFDLNKKSIPDKDAAQFIQVITYHSSDSKRVTVREYFAGFIPKSKYHYSDYSEKKKNGKCMSWYKNGYLKSAIDYTEDINHGERVTYWKNGKLKRKENLVHGNIKEGSYFDSLGNTISFYPFEKMPVFPGGLNGLSTFLAINLKYPQEALSKADDGVVYISFVVDEEGSIENPRVVKGISKELDTEALRVVDLMPLWEPAVQDGEYVKVKFMLPIKFESNLSERQKERLKRKQG